MDLEKVNNNYGKIKQKIEQWEKEYEKLNKEVERQKSEIYKQTGKLLIAKGEGNEKAIKDETEKLTELKKKMAGIKNKAKEQKEEIEESKATIEKKIQQIKNDPEISQQINKALQVRYQRQVNKLNKEKAEVVGKKAGLLNFKDLISYHPSLNNNLKGILCSTRDIKEIENKIEENKFVENGVVKFKDSSLDKQLRGQLVQANDKLQKNSQLLFDYCDKKKINKEEVKSYLDLLVDNGIVEKQNGEINIDATFDKNIKKLDKKIKSYDKRIQNYSLLVKNTQTIENAQNNINVDQIKWWQFGKRFKNWIEMRKRDRLPAPQEQQSHVQNVMKEERKSFNKNLKYDIVREAMNKQEKEDLRNAKEIRRQSREEEERKEDEREL